MKSEVDRGAQALVLLILALFYLPALRWLLQPEDALTGIGWEGARQVLWNSLAVAGGGALLATFLGLVLGVMVSAYRVPFRGFLFALWLAPLLLPTVVLTTGAQSWLADGPFVTLVRGLPGAVFLSTFQMYPLVFWGVARALGALPRHELASMRQLLPPHSVSRVLARRMFPIALRLGTLVFLLLLPRLEIPAYTGVETLGRRTLAAFTASGSDLEGWLWCACCLLIALPVLPFACAPLARGAAPFDLGRRDRWAPRSRLVTSVALGLAVIPLFLFFGLIADAGGDAVAGGAEASRWIGALGRELLRVIPLGLLMAFVGWRIAIGTSTWTIAFASVPLFIPGCMPALIWLEGLAPLLPLELGKTELPLNLAQATRFLAVSIILGRLCDRAIPQAERSAAMLLPPATRRKSVLLPRALSTLAMSSTLLTLWFLGEVESAAQVVPPGRLLPGVELHQLLHYRYDVQAARLSLVLGVVSGIAVVVVGFFGRSLEQAQLKGLESGS